MTVTASIPRAASRDAALAGPAAGPIEARRALAAVRDMLVRAGSAAAVPSEELVAAEEHVRFLGESLSRYRQRAPASAPAPAAGPDLEALLGRLAAMLPPG